MRKFFYPITFGVLTAALLLGCAAQEIPVTRLVEVQVPVTVEVTAPPVLTPVVQTAVVEVTRLVETGEPRFDGRLIVGISEYPNSLDLPQTNSPTARMAAWHLYDSLVQTDAQSNILPALAESWAISEDNLEYTFTLRRGVSFHNGEDFTADAVRFSWERGSEPANANSAAWQAVSEVVVVDDYTVRLVTAEPNVTLLRLIADQWAIVPPSYIAEVGETGFRVRPIGTGPFQFVESEQNGYITFEANPTYWNPTQPKLQNLTFRWVINPAERFDLLRNGRIHIVSGLEAAEALPLLDSRLSDRTGDPTAAGPAALVAARTALAASALVLFAR
jgi:peptide/nickel transport system substrate-binding protein